MKRNKLLKRISQALTPDPVDADFKVFDEEVSRLKGVLKEKITVKTLDEVNSKLEKYTKRIDLSSIVAALENLQNSLAEKEKSFSEDLDREVESISEQLKSISDSEDTKRQELVVKLAELEATITELQKPQEDRVTPLIGEIQALETRFNHSMAFEREENQKTASSIKKSTEEELEKKVKKLLELLETLRTDVFQRLQNVGGGNMNRQVKFNGIDYLTKYTDINWKAGTNVTFTVAENNSTKMVDITVSATGGGGGGMVRVITNIATNTIAGSAAGTDYVYLCAGTLTLTLPTAVGNTNLYTVKNTGAGIVTVDTTGGETIDGDPTVIMPVQFTSVDLISNSMAWAIT